MSGGLPMNLTDALDSFVVPDVAEPVIGYKILYVRSKAELASGFSQMVYPHGATSKCECKGGKYKKVHRPPHALCSCGWYALHKFPGQFPGHVTVAVQAWGTIHEHKDGIRAEYCKIVAITHGKFARPAFRKMAKRIAQTYGVPYFKSWDEFFKYSQTKGRTLQDPPKHQRFWNPSSRLYIWAASSTAVWVDILTSNPPWLETSASIASLPAIGYGVFCWFDLVKTSIPNIIKRLARKRVR